MLEVDNIIPLYRVLKLLSKPEKKINGKGKRKVKNRVLAIPSHRFQRTTALSGSRKQPYSTIPCSHLSIFKTLLIKQLIIILFFILLFFLNIPLLFSPLFGRFSLYLYLYTVGPHASGFYLN